MAFEYGKLLNQKYMPQLEQIVGGKFDQIVVEASPYLRTMMTAANLCRGLEIPNFKCNYMFSEF